MQTQQSVDRRATRLTPLPGFCSALLAAGDWCRRLSGAGGQTVWMFGGRARRCGSRDGWRAHKWAVEEGIGCTLENPQDGCG